MGTCTCFFLFSIAFLPEDTQRKARQQRCLLVTGRVLFFSPMPRSVRICRNLSKFFRFVSHFIPCFFCISVIKCNYRICMIPLGRQAALPSCHGSHSFSAAPLRREHGRLRSRRSHAFGSRKGFLWYEMDRNFTKSEADMGNASLPPDFAARMSQMISALICVPLAG